MTDRDILEIMRQNDPNGWETKEPTYDDYLEFKRDMIEEFGQDAWGDYNRY